MLKAAAFGTVAGVVLGWNYFRHIQLKPGPSRMTWGSAVFGHRGCRFVDGVPENTIAAFEVARDNLCSGIELDIRQCKSGELVVLHDSALSPTFRLPKDFGAKTVQECSLSRLKSLYYTADMKAPKEEEVPMNEDGETSEKVAKDDESPAQQQQAQKEEERQPESSADTAERIPTLEEAILFCRDNYLRMLIEIKETGTRNDKLITALLRLYDEYGEEFLYENSTVMSFNPFVLYQLRVKNRRIAVGVHTRPDTASILVNNPSISKPPLVFRLCPFVWDKLIEFVQIQMAPWVTGASIFSPMYTSYNAKVHERWYTRRYCLYLHGLPSHEDCTAGMRAEGVLVTADNQHVKYLK